MVYVDGEKSHRIQNEDLVEYLVKTIENKVEEIYS
jgi:4-hydroxy-3-methylbut-2-en-1-yl diphosphate synthase IspG/GcpE